jgi:nucleoside-diphosphate-sugar epimerase
VSERALITGASGFIGSFLTETLVQRGTEVHCLLRPGSSTRHLRKVLDQIHIHRADVTDRDALQVVADEARPELVFHLAATGATDIHVPPALAVRVNVEGTLNLLTALNGRYRAFVNTGTCHEYGANEPPFREDQDPRPELPYAISKTAAWHFCGRFYRTQGWPIITVRPFAVYGPRQAANTFVSACIRAAQSGQDFKMTLGAQKRDWIYVTDVVDGLIRAATVPEASGGTYNLCTSQETTLYEIAQLIVEQVGADCGTEPIAIQRGALPYRDGEIWRLVGDNTRANTILGWEPQVPLQEGIRETVHAAAGR